MPRTFIFNLIATVVLGVCFCWWVFHFTDWFEAVVSLLALGGVFSWIAFISRLLPEERQKALQAWADETVLCSKFTSAVICVIAALLLVASNFVGSIEVDSLQGASDRALTISGLGAMDAEEESLPASGALRRLHYTSWWSSTVWRVKVSGYPDKEVTLRPWRREEITVPGGLFRPVVLLRPTVDLFDAVHNNARDLVITVGANSHRAAITYPAVKFDGHALWIGCDEDVDVPLNLESAWRTESLARQRPTAFYYWLRPKIPGPPALLEAGTEIKITWTTWLANDGKPFEKKFPVLSLQRRQDFPQEVILDVPH